MLMFASSGMSSSANVWHRPPVPPKPSNGGGHARPNATANTSSRHAPSNNAAALPACATFENDASQRASLRPYASTQGVW
jgi:hypothetical protein